MRGGVCLFLGGLWHSQGSRTPGAGLGVCGPAAGVGIAALAGEEPVWEALGWGEKSPGGIQLHWDAEHTLEPGR